MQPKTITWDDGRTFAIDAVRDFRPAGTANNHFSGDCFTVLIQGQEKISAPLTLRVMWVIVILWSSVARKSTYFLSAPTHSFPQDLAGGS